ncbi:OmpH family outer membrane protein [Roseiconus lacunae]|uniref:OmpH family outer membrane protein n=1 Tax=Roseiconus lacunae TaxID=2605694 RepID=A0ABT7PM64_9BACT|nr:OmpH family outer membrane protein [Roseiconus lacunae]MCD0461516.1 OmpH family outer membrane protein [Roseiconus lacunae]MDM4017593.1 OmpH family outer membrane protein [Roseiconus lacunae]WRQ51143.1 OmpH family outer membrane protein [Stieleria sp. HD01]
MRTVRHQVYGIAIGLAAVMAPGLMATQAQAQNTEPHRVAVVDVAKIFKTHSGIRAQVAKIEADLKAFDTELKQKREQLRVTATKLKDLTPGSPDYAALEEQITDTDAKLRLEMTRKRKELADAEAKIYFDNYQHIAAGVKFLAGHYKINLVLRYNSDQMEEGVGESVIRGVMKNIVYHDEQLDMTPGVMQYLDRVIKTEVAGLPQAGKK